MPKINLVTVNTPLNSSSFQQEINSNFTAIEGALEKQLQREPQEGVNNAMQQELDMNSYRIINLGAPINPSDAARKQDVDDALRPNLEANKVLISDSEGNISNSSITNTELETLGGISGNIQAQLNSKQAVIPDLNEIRTGATAGASALQAGDLKTINGESLVGEGNIEIQATDVALANLTDVSLNSPSDDQVLGFNTSSQKWENVSNREHYRGNYSVIPDYKKGDIVQQSGCFYIARQDISQAQASHQPDPLDLTNEYWARFDNAYLVTNIDITNAEPTVREHKIGCVKYGIRGSAQLGFLYYSSNASSPTINSSTGAMSAPLLKSTTQAQGDNSTNVATTKYVDTAIASVATYNSSTKTLELV